MTELPQVAVRKILSGPFRGMVVVDSTLDQFLQNGGNPDALFQDNVTLLKSSSSTRSALVNSDHVSEDVLSKSLYVKEFRYKGVVHSLKHLFSKHRAQIMWNVSWHLLKNSIQVPEPEGYLLKQAGPFCLAGYYFSKPLRRCLSLQELTGNLAKLEERLNSGGLNQLAAHCVATLHDSGVTHGDLKWTNILVDEKENQLWFIDFDASKLWGHYPNLKAVSRDLARFVLSGIEAGVGGTMMARFLIHYASRRNLNLRDIASPMMEILQKLRKRHEKKFQSIQ